MTTDEIKTEVRAAWAALGWPRVRLQARARDGGADCTVLLPGGLHVRVGHYSIGGGLPMWHGFATRLVGRHLTLADVMYSGPETQTCKAVLREVIREARRECRTMAKVAAACSAGLVPPGKGRRRAALGGR